MPVVNYLWNMEIRSSMVLPIRAWHHVMSGSHRFVADMVIIVAKFPPFDLMALLVGRCLDQSFLLMVTSAIHWVVNLGNPR